MNWNNNEEILKVKEGDFEKEIEKIQIVDLNSRIERNQSNLNKPDLNMPMLTGSEITPIRKKLIILQHILVSVRDRKEKERFTQNQQARETWKNDYLRDNLREFRFITGSEAEHVMHGDFTVDTVQWATPQSTEYEITGVSGDTIKINLKRIIAPTTLQMMIDHPLVPVFLVVEASGMYQHNKKLGIWQSGEWDQTRGITFRAGTMIGIMKV
jgi:hypothetical protein